MPYDILLVDDDEFDRRLVLKVLGETTLVGKTDVAETGAEGLEKAAGGSYDFILLDHRLPDMDGLDVAKQLIGDPQNPEATVIMLTGFDSFEASQHAMRVGLSDYLSKDDINSGLLARAFINANERRLLLQKRIDAEKRLSDAQEQMQTILERTADGLIVIDKTGVIRRTNGAVTKIFGYEAAELLGQKIQTLMFEGEANSHDGFLADYWAGSGRKMVNMAPRELVGRHKEGRAIPVEIAISDLELDGEKCFIGSIRDITDARQRERALRAEKEFSSAVFHKSGALIVVVDENRSVIKANQTCERISGYSVSSLSQGNAWERLMQPRHQLLASKAFGRVIATGKGRDVELPLITSGGEELLINWDLSPHFDETGELCFIICTGVDVTDTRKTQRQYQLLADNTNDLVFLCKTDGKIKYASPSCAEQLGVDNEDLLAAPSVFELIFDGDRAEAERAFGRCISETRGLAFTTRFGETADTSRWYDVSARFVPGRKGLLDKVVMSARDITDRQQVEEQLRQTQKMEAIGQLTGGVAHDFNNLLTIIKGNSQLLTRSLPDQSKELERAEKITKAAESGAELTSRLLMFSRQQVLETSNHDINHIVSEVEGLLSRIMDEHIEVETVLSDTACLGTTDRNQLEHALLNLCVNARDAMPDGGRITIETRPMVLSQRYATQHFEVEAGNYIEIAVTDTGHGIPKELLQRVFEPFFSTKGSGKGTGLGLSSVFGFMKQSGGHVSVYSEEGHGTTFRLYVRQAEAELSDDAFEGVARSRSNVKKATILVAEDDDAVREIAVSILRETGVKVMEASSGSEGFQAFVEAPHVDLVFSDVIMPGSYSGPEMVAKIRELQPNVPVIFASGYAEQALKSRKSLDENTRFLAKPYDPDELVELIEEMLEQTG